MKIFIAGITATIVTGIVLFILKDKIKDGFKKLFEIIKSKIGK